MQQIVALKSWHLELMRRMLLEPQRQQQELAMEFGVSGPWLSQVVNSPLFQRRLNELRERLYTDLTEQISIRIAALADQSLEVMQERLAAEGHKLDLRDVRKIAELTLKALGYFDPKTRPSPSLAQEPVLVDRELLQGARDRYRELSNSNLNPLV